VTVINIMTCIPVTLVTILVLMFLISFIALMVAFVLIGALCEKGILTLFLQEEVVSSQLLLLVEL